MPAMSRSERESLDNVPLNEAWREETSFKQNAEGKAGSVTSFQPV